jgi:hypothetical protein
VLDLGKYSNSCKTQPHIWKSIEKEKMNFVENDIYLDREGKEYRFIAKVGGVTKFEDIKSGKTIVQHQSGRYRWDDNDHPKDIVTKK